GPNAKGATRAFTTSCSCPGKGHFQAAARASAARQHLGVGQQGEDTAPPRSTPKGRSYPNRQCCRSPRCLRASEECRRFVLPCREVHGTVGGMVCERSLRDQRAIHARIGGEGRSSNPLGTAAE